jgi:glycosyltransferase involved in cell wall biosynthesis
MRVAYLINQYPKVSHSFIRREIQAVERCGIEVIRLALRGWNSELSDEEDRLERARTRYVLRDGPWPLVRAALAMLLGRPASLFRGLALAWRMSRRAEKPLLVHLAYLAEACRIEPWLRSAGIAHLHAHFGTNSAEVAMLVHTLGGPPWSFTVHGPEEFDKALIIGLAEKVRRCAFVVAISSYGRSQLYRWIEPAHWSKVHVVPCGLEASYFSGPAVPVPETRRLVCVGRLCEQKGQLLLIEAARRLAEAGVAFDLVLAGDGEMRPDIEAAITRYRLRQVQVAGWIGSDAVRKEILAARALVLPSFAEGLPVVIMEAMALRRPVISTFVAGIPELMRSGEHGWLVPAGDLDALADALCACLDTPTDRLMRMGEAAQAMVKARHHVDAAAARLASMFARGVGRERGDGAISRPEK